MIAIPNSSSDKQSSMHRWLRPTLFKIYGALFVFFALLGSWLALDLQRGYENILADTAQRAMQRSQIIGQSFHAQVLATDYVLRDVLGRIQEKDLAYPDLDRDHAQRMAKLLKEKSDTVPDFFSMVIFNRDCVFAATATGKNLGVRSKQELCEARKMHSGTGPLVTYVAGKNSASGQSVLVLSRHLTSPAGDFQGGVLGVIELSTAQHWLDSMRLDLGSSVALLDDAQVLLARHPLLVEAIEKPVTAFAIPAILRSTAADASVATQRDLEGRERIFGFSKIEGFPFIVAYGIDKAKVVEDWQRRAVELTVGYFTLLLLALLAARSYWIILRQREELEAGRSALQELAWRDPLTGLYNRRFLDAALPRELSRAEREGTPIAIIMLDLDHFKEVNDQYSHAAGDEVLKALAEILKTGARESDLICRYGGEEFMAIMPNMSANQALERVESWRKQLEKAFVVYSDFKISITLSAGIAVYPDHGSNPSLLLTCADEMLYKSKREGRNRISVCALK